MVVPLHYFLFQDFRPEVMRLKQGNYFEYFDYDPDAQKILKGHQQEAEATYKVYLPYDALLTCLEINDLVDAGAVARIEAHYTFLGQFLHPTHDAARELHDNSKYHEGKPAIGMNSPYKKSARLLAALYVCYLVAGVLEEIALAHENAPKKYIADPGTEDLRRLIDEAPTKFHYFCFLFNEPTLYDKFQHYNAPRHRRTNQAMGRLRQHPPELIKFNQHILGQLQHALNSWTGGKAGRTTVHLSPTKPGWVALRLKDALDAKFAQIAGRVVLGIDNGHLVDIVVTAVVKRLRGPAGYPDISGGPPFFNGTSAHRKCNLAILTCSAAFQRKVLPLRPT